MSLVASEEAPTVRIAVCIRRGLGGRCFADDGCRLFGRRFVRFGILVCRIVHRAKH